MKQKEIKLYMDFAEKVAKLSTAKRLQVGAVLARGNHILCYAYNGTPPGWDNECETFEKISDTIGYGMVTKPEVIHAEENIIRKMSQSTETTEGSRLFITHNPCPRCASRLVGLGITHIYYREQYRDITGVAALKNSGIIVEQLW